MLKKLTLTLSVGALLAAALVAGVVLKHSGPQNDGHPAAHSGSGPQNDGK